MKRQAIMSILGVLGSFGCVRAQSYAGFGVSQLLLTAPVQYGLPVLLEGQVGGQTAPEFGSFEVRASFGTILLFSNFGVDALASLPLSGTALRLYLGGGPDMFVLLGWDTLPGQESPFVFFGVHGTVGLEPLTGSVRPFAELQPALALRSGEPVIGLRARAGMKFYF